MVQSLVVDLLSEKGGDIPNGLPSRSTEQSAEIHDTFTSLIRPGQGGENNRGHLGDQTIEGHLPGRLGIRATVGELWQACMIRAAVGERHYHSCCWTDSLLPKEIGNEKRQPERHDEAWL
ncbi:hypothetical protein [Embleya scabrispora]|uniref:hypothetical protein n=1 Tax=Embleya scabrispora TaxID=159449 RepID=UPI001F252837|nr:hypothetical protein [Embleya scabrispora]